MLKRLLFILILIICTSFNSFALLGDMTIHGWDFVSDDAVCGTNDVGSTSDDVMLTVEQGVDDMQFRVKWCIKGDLEGYTDAKVIYSNTTDILVNWDNSTAPYYYFVGDQGAPYAANQEFRFYDSPWLTHRDKISCIQTDDHNPEPGWIFEAHYGTLEFNNTPSSTSKCLEYELTFEYLGTGGQTYQFAVLLNDSFIPESAMHGKQGILLQILENGNTDNTPPNSSTNLQNISAGYDWIYWNWTNPTDSDFSHNQIYINGASHGMTTNNYYNLTEISEGTNYTITLHSVDLVGNINDTDVNRTGRTLEYPYVEINSCREINDTMLDGKNEVRLNQSLSTTGTCFDVQSANIIFDCQRNNIDGDDGSTDWGFSIGVNNVTVKNCDITDFGRGFTVFTENSIFENINISSSNYAFFGSGSSYNILRNMDIESNNYGIYFQSSSNYNNLSSVLIQDNTKGVTFTSNVDDNIINNSMIINSTERSISIYSSTNNKILNSKLYGGSYYDIDITTSVNSHCNHLFSNVTNVDNQYITYLNQSKIIDGWNNISLLYLCNADNSQIKNINYDGIYNKSYFIYTQKTDNSNFTNITIDNFRYGLYIKSSSGNNFSNIYSNNNVNNGLFIDSSTSNIFSNIVTNNNLDYGTYIYLSSYNNFSNLSSNNNLHGIVLRSNNNNLNDIFTINNSQTGLLIYSALNNEINNFSSINNTEGMILFQMSDFNNISNFNISLNRNRGILFNTRAYNSLLFNGSILNNIGKDIHFYSGVGTPAHNNTFYNCHIESKDEILIDYDFNTYPNYFNYTVSGVGNIGNYWNDLTCLESEARGSYYVCTTPATYTVDAVNNGYDYAPLVSSLIIPPVVLTPVYVLPTPTNNSHIIGTSISFKYTNGSASDDANISIDNINYSMVYDGGGNWSYTYIITSNNIKEVDFKVYYNGGSLEQRTFTLYPDYNQTSTVPGLASFSLLITLLIISSLFIPKKPNKKALAPIVATLMLLAVSVSVFFAVNNWFYSLESDFQAKQLQNIENIGKGINVHGIKYVDSVPTLYMLGNFYGYKKIESIKLNDQQCTMLVSNVMVGNSLSRVELDCPEIKDINDLKIFTREEVIQRSIKIIS